MKTILFIKIRNIAISLRDKEITQQEFDKKLMELIKEG